MSTPAVLPEAQPMSHVGSTRTGVLVIHGFTGNPSSMRGIAEAMAELAHHVEMPRLPGHGTTVEEMVTTDWSDWTGEVRSAHARLADRVDQIVVVGLSMGGSLTLWSGFELSKVAGLVAINPATTPEAPEVLAMIQEMVDDGTEIAPAIGGDIADPDVQESSYDGAPLRPLLKYAYPLMLMGLAGTPHCLAMCGAACTAAAGGASGSVLIGRGPARARPRRPRDRAFPSTGLWPAAWARSAAGA